METEPTEPLTLFVLSAGLEALEEPEAVRKRRERQTHDFGNRVGAARESASRSRAPRTSRRQCPSRTVRGVSGTTPSTAESRRLAPRRLDSGNWRDASSANAPYGNLPSDFLHLRHEGVSRRAARAARRGRPVARRARARPPTRSRPPPPPPPPPPRARRFGRPRRPPPRSRTRPPRASPARATTAARTTRGAKRKDKIPIRFRSPSPKRVARTFASVTFASSAQRSVSYSAAMAPHRASSHWSIASHGAAAGHRRRAGRRGPQRGGVRPERAFGARARHTRSPVAADPPRERRGAARRRPPSARARLACAAARALGHAARAGCSATARAAAPCAPRGTTSPSDCAGSGGATTTGRSSSRRSARARRRRAPTPAGSPPPRLSSPRQLSLRRV